MRKNRFSQLVKEVLSKGNVISCGLALLAIGIAAQPIPIPTSAWNVKPEAENIPYVCTELGPSSLGAAGKAELRWKDKSELRVRFLDGSEFLKAQVKHYARFWSKYANIQFEFVETGPSDIRVSFDPNGRSWSYIGTSAKRKNENEPTMNFGWFDENKTTPVEFRRTILHEFGHALGLIHEHQSPGAVMNWNKETVYRYYRNHFGWNENVVNDNIFNKYERRQTQYSAYDPDSIMHYPIPAEFTTDGTSVGWNTNSSRIDMDFVRKVYP